METDISYIKKDGHIYIRAESIEGFLNKQATEIRINYTANSGIPTEGILGVLAGLKLSGELIARAVTVSEIDSILGESDVSDV